MDGAVILCHPSNPRNNDIDQSCIIALILTLSYSSSAPMPQKNYKYRSEAVRLGYQREVVKLHFGFTAIEKSKSANCKPGIPFSSEWFVEQKRGLVAFQKTGPRYV